MITVDTLRPQACWSKISDAIFKRSLWTRVYVFIFWLFSNEKLWNMIELNKSNKIREFVLEIKMRKKCWPLFTVWFFEKEKKTDAQWNLLHVMG